ncbi:T9SS type A sorting domain-containing protein [Kordia sp. TARA_039_SRF]|nr:T9SS type A sorting domain-containing protein [Kordia sp. TARA_039_SRF]
MKNTITMCLLLAWGVSFGQFCEDFNDGNPDIANWLGVAAGANTADPFGPSGTADDIFLHSYDDQGASYIYNNVDYAGDWREFDGQCLCWDFQVIEDGNFGEPVSPRLIIYTGPPTSPTASATFVANVQATEGGGWVHVCAPINICEGTDLPSNENGQWVMATGSDCSDWNNLISNISGIRFFLDLTSSPTEEYGYDNICIQECDIDTGEPNNEGAFCCEGDNLVENGNFENGANGFGSDYVEDAALFPGAYHVSNDASIFGTTVTDHSACADPEQYSNNTDFLLVNGRTTQPAGTTSVIWEQSIPIDPEKVYKFCANFKDLPQCTFNIKPEIRLEVNGQLYNWITIDTNSDDPCDWQQISECFEGDNDVLDIKIHLKEDGLGDGNDLAIDDISLQEKLDQNLNISVLHQGSPLQITGSINSIDTTDDSLAVNDVCTEQNNGYQYTWFVYELEYSSFPFTNPLDFINMVPNTFAWSSNIGGFNNQLPTSTNPVWGLTTTFPNYNFDPNKLYVIGLYVPSCCDSCYDEDWSYQITLSTESSSSQSFNVFTDEVKDHLRSLFVMGETQSGTLGREEADRINFTMFPNPTTNVLQFRSDEPIVSYKITDISGRLIQSNATEVSEIDVSQLSSNMYFLTVTTQSGIQHTEKFIKE